MVDTTQQTPVYPTEVPTPPAPAAETDPQNILPHGWLYGQVQDFLIRVEEAVLSYALSQPNIEMYLLRLPPLVLLDILYDEYYPIFSALCWKYSIDGTLTEAQKNSIRAHMAELFPAEYVDSSFTRMWDRFISHRDVLLQVRAHLNTRFPFWRHRR